MAQPTQTYYIFFQGGGNNGALNSAKLTLGNQVGVNYKPDNVTSHPIGLSSSPSVAMYKGLLYVAHQGSGNNGELWCTTFNTANWPTNGADVRVPNVGLSSSPSLAVYNDILYCAHQGSHDNGELWVTSFNGSSWGADVRVPNVGMSSSPSLAVFDGKLHCAHQGYGNNGQLWITSFDGSSWGADVQIQGAQLSSSPSLAVFKDTQNVEYLFCGYQDAHDTGFLFSSYAQSGGGWTWTQRGVSDDSAHPMMSSSPSCVPMQTWNGMRWITAFCQTEGNKGGLSFWCFGPQNDRALGGYVEGVQLSASPAVYTETPW